MEILQPESGNPRPVYESTAYPRSANARPRPAWSALEPPKPLVVKMVGTRLVAEAVWGLYRSASMTQDWGRPCSSRPAGTVNESPVSVSYTHLTLPTIYS